MEENDDNYLFMAPRQKKKVREETVNRYLADVGLSSNMAGRVYRTSESFVRDAEPENNEININENYSVNESEHEHSVSLEEYWTDIVPELSQYEIPLETARNEASDISDSESDEGDVNKGTLLASKIRQLIFDGHINVTVTNLILKSIRECDLGITLPRNYNDLMDIPTKTKQPTKIKGGEYIHMGIQHNFLRMDSEIFNETPEITLDVSFDGVPGFNSSNQQLWVISGGVVNKRIEPVIIGIFVGDTKPHNPAEFFYLTLEELQKLRIEGILIGPDKVHKPFRTRAMIADTPARCWATGALGHAGIKSCPVCNQIGTRVGSYTVFSPYVGELRTNESFRNRDDPEYNK